MAEAVSGLPIERAFVVHGAPGWDEATPCGTYLMYDVRPGRVERRERDPRELGIPRCEPVDLAGGDAGENARRLRDVFGGERGPHRDAIVLGTALALEVTGCRPREAIDAAQAALDDGAAATLLDRLKSFTEAER
jgi:anthranilate phosphoribosyltransferase